MSNRTVRYIILALLLVLGTIWSLASAKDPASSYPEKNLLVTAQWLKKNMDDPDLVIIDVRMDKYFDGKLIPGAIRLPWREFRFTDTARGVGGAFIGVARAQELLGANGITRADKILLYDSVKRDGGATSSYLFWVLDVLGHDDKMILEQGIDGWIQAGNDVVEEPEVLEPTLYQAPKNQLRLDRWVDGDFIYERLGDTHYQILDVRSRGEYLGEKPNKGLDGTVLKLGHIPTAYNINYELNWMDPETKKILSYPELQNLYSGLDPVKTQITYCHSARRGSFGYFILRLMGFEKVSLYDGSWFEWGNEDLFYPVETKDNNLAGALPDARKTASTSKGKAAAAKTASDRQKSSSEDGYISCGG